MTAEARLTRLELDIDCRIAGLWEDLAGIDTFTLDKVAVFMRAAYGMGYSDAMRDPEPEQFFLQHGYRAPKRVSALADRIAPYTIGGDPA